MLNFCKGKSDNVSINFVERIDTLILELEKSEECKLIYNKLSDYYAEIERSLPGDKKCLTMRIDDTITDLLILYEDYFYQHGYNDYIYFNGKFGFKKIIRKIVSCLIKYLGGYHDYTRGKDNNINFKNKF